MLLVETVGSLEGICDLESVFLLGGTLMQSCSIG